MSFTYTIIPNFALHHIIPINHRKIIDLTMEQQQTEKNRIAFMIQRPCNSNFWQSPAQTWMVQQHSELPWGQQSLCCNFPSSFILWSNSYCPLIPTKPGPLQPSWTPEQAENHPIIGEEWDKIWARGTLQVAGKNHRVHYRPRTATSGEKWTSLQNAPD